MNKELWLALWCFSQRELNYSKTDTLYFNFPNGTLGIKQPRGFKYIKMFNGEPDIFNKCILFILRDVPMSFLLFISNDSVNIGGGGRQFSFTLLNYLRNISIVSFNITIQSYVFPVFSKKKNPSCTYSYLVPYMFCIHDTSIHGYVNYWV